MTPIFILLHAMFGLLLWGTGPGARYLFIVLLALMSAPLSLFLFKRLSRQKRLALLRNRIRGNIMQLSIYPDRFGIIISSLGAVIADTLRSLAESILPLAIISIPLSLVMLEVNNFCGSESLKANEEFVIHVVADEDTTSPAFFSIGHSPNIELLTPVLHIDAEESFYWRAKMVTNAGNNPGFVRLSSGTTEVSVPVATGVRLKHFGSLTMKPAVPGGLLYNANGFLPANSLVESISISYRRATYPFLWWDLDALVLYIILTMLCAVIIKPFMGVHI